MKAIQRIAFSALTMIAAAAHASGAQVTYLSCNLPAHEEVAARHFDFVLDEANSTVSFFVKEANATNKEDAVFGAETVTWSNTIPYGKLTRTINRVDLTYTEDFQINGAASHLIGGTCSIVKKPSLRKF